MIEKQKTIDELVLDGWEHKSNFADNLKIYGKEQERVIYVPKTDEILIKYTLGD